MKVPLVLPRSSTQYSFSRRKTRACTCDTKLSPGSGTAQLRRTPDRELVCERERRPRAVVRAYDGQLVGEAAPFACRRCWPTAGACPAPEVGRRRDDAGFAQLDPDGAQHPQEEEVEQRQEDVLEEPEGRIGHLRPTRLEADSRRADGDLVPVFQLARPVDPHAVDLCAVGAAEIGDLPGAIRRPGGLRRGGG